jgi:hypothetical protein
MKSLLAFSDMIRAISAPASYYYCSGAGTS